MSPSRKRRSIESDTRRHPGAIDSAESCDSRGGVILIAALYYSFWFSPKADEVAKLADSVEIARNEKTVKTQKAANLSRLRQDLQRLDAELKKAIAQLPEKKEIPELLSSISSKAQQSGLDVLLFRPRPESYQEFYAEVPVDITVKGNFHNTVNFFDD